LGFQPANQQVDELGIGWVGISTFGSGTFVVCLVAK
jgi:hypothetical protein